MEGNTGLLPDYGKDCADSCGGSAIFDDCGICDGGNADKDCNGDCFGTAYLNECNICVEGNIGAI